MELASKQSQIISSACAVDLVLQFFYFSLCERLVGHVCASVKCDRCMEKVMNGQRANDHTLSSDIFKVHTSRQMKCEKNRRK